MNNLHFTPVHPGDVLQDELEEIGLTQSGLAKHIGVLPKTIKIFKRIKQKASSLYTFPERGRIVPELRDQGILQYRELVISPWRILYRISEKRVLVLSVLDSRRNIEALDRLGRSPYLGSLLHFPC
jgi:plasmid stabilization system protein ParE